MLHSSNKTLGHGSCIKFTSILKLVNVHIHVKSSSFNVAQGIGQG